MELINPIGSVSTLEYTVGAIFCLAEKNALQDFTANVCPFHTNKSFVAPHFVGMSFPFFFFFFNTLEFSLLGSETCLISSVLQTQQMEAELGD